MTSAIPMDLALFFVATLLGAVVAGVAGFAFGLIASAIWLHIIPPAQSAPLIAAFAILIQGATLWKLRHAVQISRLASIHCRRSRRHPIGGCRPQLDLTESDAGIHRRGADCLQRLQLGPAHPSSRQGRPYS